jgi:hypothetical protein
MLVRGQSGESGGLTLMLFPDMMSRSVVSAYTLSETLAGVVPLILDMCLETTVDVDRGM